MACAGLGVLFDTCVFVPCLLQIQGSPSELVQIVRTNNLYIVVCPQIVDQYMEVANREYANSGFVIRQMLDMFESEGLLKWAPINEATGVRIRNQKDQIFIYCAFNNQYQAHMIVTDDTDHFEITQSGSWISIMSSDDFLNGNTRENHCRDCKQRT